MIGKAPALGRKLSMNRIWSGRLIGDRHTAAGRPVAFALRFQVEPHDELSRLAVVDHFGAFEDAAPGDVALGLCGEPQGDPLVFPVDISVQHQEDDPGRLDHAVPFRRGHRPASNDAVEAE